MRKDRKILILNTREFPSRLKKENDWKEQFDGRTLSIKTRMR